MKFEDIFKEEGLYTSNSFGQGVCFEVRRNQFDDVLELYTLTYKDVKDTKPSRCPTLVYADLFNKIYTPIMGVQSLFGSK